MTEIQNQIEETIGALVHLDKVKSQLSITESELSASIFKVQKVEKRLNREAMELDKLEGLSTKSIFYKILGSKEEQLDKERQDYLVLSLQYEELNNSIKLMEYEVNLLSAKISGRDDLVAKLERLKDAREAEIIESDPLLRKRLYDISADLEKIYRLKKELGEAIEAGNLSYNMIDQVALLLRKVQDWGQWGGRRRKRRHRYARRDSIDKARNLAFQVKHHLHLFDKELGDLGKKLNIDLDTSDFSDFTHFFFDNLITDWITHKKVTKALYNVQRTGNRIKELLDQLTMDFDKTEVKILDLKEKKEKLLTQ